MRVECGGNEKHFVSTTHNFPRVREKVFHCPWEEKLLIEILIQTFSAHVSILIRGQTHLIGQLLADEENNIVVMVNRMEAGPSR